MNFLLKHPAGKSFLILAVVLLDQWTKILAQAHLKNSYPRVYLGGAFRLEYAENSGAFLSLGATLSAETRFWIFVVAVGGILLYALYQSFFAKKIDRVTLFSLLMICGGGIGNLIDRSTRPNHSVVDFLNMGVGSIRTGIFNVADMAIMLGVILLALLSFFPKARSAGSAEANPDQRV